MKAVEAPDTAQVLDPVLDILSLALAPENDSQLLGRFLSYLFHYSHNLDKPQFLMKFKTFSHPDMKTKGLSLAEQFIAEGVEKGRQTTLVATLERQLTRRFGAVPATRGHPPPATRTILPKKTIRVHSRPFAVKSLRAFRGLFRISNRE